MSITDELRECASVSWDPWPEARDRLLKMCDRIDVEHKKACDDAWDNGYEADYLGIEKWLTEHPQVMEHHGWIRLPKDADGVPWRIGDRTESGQTIQAMGLNKHGWHFVGTVNDIDPSIHRHYHAPTVEDVLREFADKVCNSGHQWGLDAADTIAEYAKRLTLAEGEDA